MEQLNFWPAERERIDLNIRATAGELAQLDYLNCEEFKMTKTPSSDRDFDSRSATSDYDIRPAMAMIAES